MSASAYSMPSFCTSVRCVTRMREEEAMGSPSREEAQIAAAVSSSLNVRGPIWRLPPSANPPTVRGVAMSMVPSGEMDTA